jgi:hypothetical protein
MKRRPCNLCGARFTARSAFERYCAACRSTEEILQFSEWLPDPAPARRRDAPEFESFREYLLERTVA